MCRSRAAAVLVLWALAAPLAAWQDRFDQWQASGDVQAMQIYRPDQALAPSGPLNSLGAPATGIFQDGLWASLVEAHLSGPLGWDGFSLTLNPKTDLNSAAFGDLYVQWDSPWRWRLRAGQERLPMGWEQQLGAVHLVTIQRSLMFGFANYGHVGLWGLGLLNERAWGLRGDRSWDWTQGGLDLQAGGFDGGGADFTAAVFAQGRLSLRQQFGPLGLQIAADGLYGRASLLSAANTYIPLGQTDPAQPPEAGDFTGGKGALSLEGLDAGLDAGPLHARAEALLETLAGWRRGGLEATAWLDLPGWQTRKPALYARDEQAFTNRPDGVHRPNALYRAETLGLSSPVAWGSSLKLEAVNLEDEDFQPFAGGRIYQAAWQCEF
jgi:hypothetical protein